MSYWNIFDRQFIKTSDGRVITFAIVGDSSLREGLYDRRMVRSVCPLLSNDLGEPVTLSLDEILLKVQGEFEESVARRSSSEEDFDLEAFTKNYLSWITIKINSTYGSLRKYKSFYKTGVKKALTIEQVKEVDQGFQVVAHSYRHTFSKIARTTEKLDELVLEAAEWEKQHNERVYWSHNLNDHSYVWLRRKYFPNKKWQKINAKAKEIYGEF